MITERAGAWLYGFFEFGGAVSLHGGLFMLSD